MLRRKNNLNLKLFRYETSSEAKSLICKELKIGLISGQVSSSLGFSGFGGYGRNLSTKLSTEIMGLCEKLYKSSSWGLFQKITSYKEKSPGIQ